MESEILNDKIQVKAGSGKWVRLFLDSQESYIIKLNVEGSSKSSDILFRLYDEENFYAHQGQLEKKVINYVMKSKVSNANFYFKPNTSGIYFVDLDNGHSKFRSIYVNLVILKTSLKSEKNLDDLNTESYRLLKKLESRMRQFLGKELSELNTQWWKQLIPGDVKQNAEERKNKDEERKNWKFEKQDLINYIDFTDYAKIIIQKNNWKEVFQYVFHDKNKIEGKLKEIEPIRHTISHSRDLDDLEERQMKFYSEEILRSISYYYDNKKQIMKEKSKIKEPITLPQISVSFDRTVYPLHSTVHLRANMPKVILGAPIIFQVFNSKGKLLVTKEIIPEKYDNIELKNAGLYETSFVMEGNDWKVGEEYVLKGKHSTTEAKSFTRIDARKPVLQSDKSIYLWGSDMILTIIDPDADKDNNVPEIAGDRYDSKLVIASSKGRIENYRLRETGDSTGIFQGILGFIGVNKDGTKAPYDANGKTVYETQGTEYDNGFLEVSENDELKITYENATGKSELTACVIKDFESLQK